MRSPTSDRARPYPGTILLIDDNAPIERLIHLILGGAGYDVLTARNGREAIDILHREIPSLILCDLELPDVSGFDVLRRIRDDRRLANVPVVAFTVLAMPDEVSHIEAAGFDGHITKPVEPDSFLVAVASYLSG